MNILPFVGTHPFNATVFSEDEFSALIKANESGIAGIGEVGLDPSYPVPMKSQKIIFEFFLSAAEKFDLPMNLHSRKSEDMIIELLKSFDTKGILFHWFAGSPKQLENLSDNGWFLSVGPSALYSKRIMQIGKSAPMNLILTETDAPVAYSSCFSNTITSQHLIPTIILKISQLRGENFEDVRSSVSKNAARFIGRDRLQKFTR